MNPLKNLLTKALPSLLLGQPPNPTPTGPCQDGWTTGVLQKSTLTAPGSRLGSAPCSIWLSIQQTECVLRREQLKLAH